jgi:hypothetical protein
MRATAVPQIPGPRPAGSGGSADAAAARGLRLCGVALLTALLSAVGADAKSFDAPLRDNTLVGRRAALNARCRKTHVQHARAQLQDVTEAPTPSPTAPPTASPTARPTVFGPGVGPAALNVTIIDSAMWPQFPREWLSANLDTATLLKGSNLRDPVLVNLVRTLAPFVLRVGGTAANDLRYYGNVSTDKCKSLCEETWLDLLWFVQATDSTLLFDFSRQPRTADTNIFDPVEALQMFDVGLANGYGDVLANAIWQSANEDSSSFANNGTLRALDFFALRDAAASRGIGTRLIGPSVGGVTDVFRNDFLSAMGPALMYYSAHMYPLSIPTQCTVAAFTNLTGMSNRLSLTTLRAAITKYGGPNTLIYNEETAHTAGGGCPGIGQSFVSALNYVALLRQCAVNGHGMVGRQALFGWAFLGRVASYALLGPPGWVSGPGLLPPHPDYFAHVLWRQIVGSVVLTNSLPTPIKSQTWMNFWCPPAGEAGLVAVFANGHTFPVKLSPMLPGARLAPAAPRLEWILTSTSEAYANISAVYSDYPASLLNDFIFLNGQLMVINSDGTLPQNPIAGALIASGDIVVPAFSFGFFKLLDASATTCNAPSAAPTTRPTMRPTTARPTAEPTTAVPTTATPSSVPTVQPTVFVPQPGVFDPANTTLAWGLTSLLRINSGALSAMIDSATGLTWAADAYFIGGIASAADPTVVIAGAGSLASMYRSRRFFSLAATALPCSVAYRVPVMAGDYIVRLHVANTLNATSSVGQRVYDICVGDMANPVRRGFDVVLLAGNSAGRRAGRARGA